MKRFLSFALAVVLMAVTLAFVPMENAQAESWVFPLPTGNAPYYVTVLNKYSTGSEHSSYINQYVLGGSSAPNNIVMDIAASKNTPIYAVADGTVTINKYTSGSGNHVVIKHSDGSYSYYGHLIELSSAAKGSTVKAGQQIGKVGMTGTATGYHIHFEWSKHDPYCLFANAGYVKIYNNSGASAYPHNHSGSSTTCTCSTAYAGSYKVKGTSGSLAISSGHGASNAAGNTSLGFIPEGATVTISKAMGYNGQGSSSGKYGHVTYNGISGYCAMNYLEKVTSGTTTCSCSASYAGWYTQKSSDGLYISSGHGAAGSGSNAILGTIPYNAKIYISKAQGYNGQGSSSGKYGHVTYGGVSGYCAMNLLAKVASYTLTLNANGGSVSKSSFTVWNGIGDWHDLSDYIPTRSGYIFQGWYTAASNGTQVYNSNGMCTNEGTYWKNSTYVRGANATLYAQWIPDTVFAQSISVNPMYDELIVYQSTTLTAEVLPANTTNKSVVWTSSDPEVATVENGVVSTHRLGTAFITASTTDGSGLSATCEIEVQCESFESFSAPDVLALSGVGNRTRLIVITSPAGVMDTIVYTSDDPSIATVDNKGVITAASVGSTFVNATLPDGSGVGIYITVVDDMPLMELPTDLTMIEDEAFVGIDAQRVQIPDGCTYIGSRAFAECMSLCYVAIPDSVTKIADDAFENCYGDLMIYCSEGSAAYDFVMEHGFGIMLED